MSKAGSYLLPEEETIADKFSQQAMYGTRWTEPINSFIVHDEVCLHGIVNFEFDNILDQQARVVVTSFCKVIEQLSQATVTSVRLIHSISSTHDFQEQDVWVEMPPRSVRDITMNVQRMGRGEPLKLPEEFSIE